jgi:hypothetical protein
MCVTVRVVAAGAEVLFPFPCWSLHKAHEAARHDSGKSDSALLFKLAQVGLEINDQVLGFWETYVVLMFLNF